MVRSRYSLQEGQRESVCVRDSFQLTSSFLLFSSNKIVVAFFILFDMFEIFLDILNDN